MKKYRFTLIELLVVIGIAAMLTSIAIPAYNKVINSNQTDRAAAALKLALEQAQVRAISSRKNVALIIPTGNSGKFFGESNGVDDTPDFNSSTYTKYYLGSARMAYVEKTGGNWKFSRWVPETKWLEPFANAKIVAITDKYSDLPDKEGEKLSNYVKSVTADAYNGSSDGGFVQINGLPKNPNARCGIIFSPLGGMRETRRDLYIAVAECRTNSTSLSFPNGEDPLNYIILDVNHLNGKVSYHVYEK